MKKIIGLSLLVFFTTLCLQAQDYGGFAFGVKGGLSVGIQKWNNGERDPLYTYHGVAFMESLPVEGKFAVFSQLGYHVRGSAIRFRAFTNINGDRVNVPTTKYEFNNIALALGGKQRFAFGENSYFYYLLGIRGEYTITTNLQSFEELNTAIGGLYYPSEVFVRDFNYGMIAGGGMEFTLAERVGILVELTVNPDISYQYRQPQIQNVPDPYFGGTRTLQEQLVRNTTLELSLGFRFLRIVEYID